MLEAITKEIGGYEFKFQPLMATPARTLFDKLVNRFGPTIASAMEGLEQANELNLEQETEDQAGMIAAMFPALGSGIRELSGALNENFHRDIVKTLGDQTHVRLEEDGEFVSLRKEVREVLFAQKLTLEFKWLGFCLGVQFADFFELFKAAALKAVVAKAVNNESRSSFQKISTGSFSGSQRPNDTQVD